MTAANPANQPSVWIVIPAYNEATIIQEVLHEILATGYTNILLIDDGSTDDTAGKAREIENVVVLRHMINRGKGAAAKTGIEAAKLLGADIVVTLDADGQHNPSDIAPMIDLITHKNYDVVLGSRLQKCDGMPWYKIAHNRIGNFLVWMIYGLWVTDSQSGFRAYSEHALHLIKTRTDRYEYDSEVIYEIARHKLRYIEIPIEVRYTAYSMGKQHKMNLKTGIKMLAKMLLYD
ncbi:MAG: glycosyltransferase family 2 protein [Candidatus Moraniibacteriota bacterium]